MSFACSYVQTFLWFIDWNPIRGLLLTDSWPHLFVMIDNRHLLGLEQLQITHLILRTWRTMNVSVSHRSIRSSIPRTRQPLVFTRAIIRLIVHQSQSSWKSSCTCTLSVCQTSEVVIVRRTKKSERREYKQWDLSADVSGAKQSITLESCVCVSAQLLILVPHHRRLEPQISGTEGIPLSPPAMRRGAPSCRLHHTVWDWEMNSFKEYFSQLYVELHLFDSALHIWMSVTPYLHARLACSCTLCR